MRLAHQVLTLTLLANTLVSNTGCTAWRVETTPLPAVLDRRPSALQVRVADSAFVLHQPTLGADTLHGLVGRGNAARPAAVAASDVQSVATRHVHAVRTALLVAGIAIPVALVAFAVALENSLSGL